MQHSPGSVVAEALQHILYLLCQAALHSTFSCSSAVILLAHLGAGESCPLGGAPCQVFALQCILHLISVFFFPFVLWLYANFVRDEDQGYLFSLIINSLSILFSFLFGRGLHCHRTAAVVPTLFSFVCLSA